MESVNRRRIIFIRNILAEFIINEVISHMVVMFILLFSPRIMLYSIICYISGILETVPFFCLI